MDQFGNGKEIAASESDLRPYAFRFFRDRPQIYDLGLQDPVPLGTTVNIVESGSNVVHKKVIMEEIIVRFVKNMDIADIVLSI